MILVLLAAGFLFNFPREKAKEPPRPKPPVAAAVSPVTESRPALPSRGCPRVLKVVATGYTADYESTGKRPGDPGYGITSSGLPAAPGACAVDPSAIPLRSILYVPGYGYAVAIDVGGAVKGNRVDLFFQDKQKALDWGKRTVEVTLVERR